MFSFLSKNKQTSQSDTSQSTSGGVLSTSSASSSPVPENAPSGKKLPTPSFDTGRNVDKIVEGLFLHMNDSSTEVRDQIRTSLEQLGDEEPILVLSKGLSFLNTTSRSNKSHRVLVMNLMTQVLDSKETLDLPPDLSNAIIQMSVLEIVAEKSISSEWQNSANVLLIAVTRLAPDISAKLLLENFPQGKFPHYFIIKSLADFAHRYPKDFIPYLKEILSRTLTLLGMLKHDNLKWVFAAGLGRWAEAVVRVSEDETNFNPRDFSGPIHSALKHALQDWLMNRQGKIRLACAEGTGYMCHIIETEHLQELLPTLLPQMVKLMKKEAKEQLPVTIGMHNLLYVVMRDIPEKLEEHIEALYTSIHSYLVATIQNTKYEKWKENFEELCKCMEILCKNGHYTDKIVTFMQKQVAASNTETKIASLRALAHLIVTCDEELSPYKDQLVSSLNLANAKTESMSVLSSFVDVIRAMGEYNYLQAQGGTDLVQIVIKGCSISEAAIDAYKKKGKVTKNPPDVVRQKCDDIITEFTSGPYSSQMDSVLWPFLLESFVAAEYADAFVILCKGISDIAKRKKNDDDFIINFEQMVNLPKPDQLFARLIVMLSAPFERNQSGVNILRALYCLSPNLHPQLVEVWSRQLPQMKKQFLDNQEEFDQDKWETSILNLIRMSIDSVADDQWNVSVGDAILGQASLYEGQAGLKKVLLCIAGLIVQKTNYKEFVVRAVSSIFTNTNHNDDVERLGCARGLGQASQTHTDPVLTRLSRVMQAKEQKRSFFSRQTEPPVTSESKATALLCYAYVCRLTPPDLVRSRMDVHVIANIVPVLKGQKIFVVQENGLTCLDYIGKSVTPDRIEGFVLKARDELVTICLEIMKPEPPVKGKTTQAQTDQSMQLLLSGLETLATLIALPPKMAPDIQANVLKQNFELMDSEMANEEILGALYSMLSVLLRSDLTQGNLEKILAALEKYLRSSSRTARQRASATYVFLLQEYGMAISEHPQEADSFYSCGKLIGLLTPRITEPLKDVRRNALDCIYLVLRIQHSISQKDGSELPEAAQQIGPLRGELDSSEPEQMLKVSKTLGNILVETITQDHFQDLLDTILATLNDVEEDASNGSCVVLNTLIRSRGNELEKTVDKYVTSLLDAMSRLSLRKSVVTGLLFAMRCFAKHFPMPVITALLKSSVPHSTEVVASIREFAKDKDLLSTLLDHLIDILNNSQLYDEKQGKSGVVYVSLPIVDSATAALHEVLSAKECKTALSDYYHKIVATVVVRIGSANMVSVNPPVQDAQLCLKNLLALANDDIVLKKLDVTPNVLDKLLNTNEYPEGIQTVLQYICESHQSEIRKIFDFVKAYVNRTYLGQKVAATAAVSVLLNNIANDREMVNDAINCLLSRSGLDEPVVVKLYAIRGLAKLHKHPKDILHRFLTPIMTLMISAIEDKDENIILETMTSIQQLFEVADDEYASAHLLNLSIRLKPSFEKPNPKLRSASIELFGTLSRFCKGQQGDALLNKVFENLPTIILHLRDPENEVVLSCKKALAQLVPQLGKDRVSSIFTDLKEDELKNNFKTFANEFAEAWVQDFPERISELSMNMVPFFESQWPELCSSSCLIMGFLLAALNDEQRQRVNLRHTCSGIVKLLKSQHVPIREAAAHVLGLLHES